MDLSFNYYVFQIWEKKLKGWHRLALNLLLSQNAFTFRQLELMLQNLLIQLAQWAVDKNWDRLPHKLHETQKDDVLHQIYAKIIDVNVFYYNFKTDKKGEEIPLEHLYPTLYSYSWKKIFRGISVEAFREVSGDTNLGRSNLGVLSRESTSRLKVKNALTDAGRTGTTFDQYFLIWRVFKEYIESTKISVDKLTLNDFQKMADLYKQRSNPPKTLTADSIKTKLDEIAEAVRNYDLPIFVDDDKINYKVVEPDDSDESFDQNQVAQVAKLIQQQLQILEPLDQTILCLHFAQGMSQEEIETKLNNLSQSTVSRRLNRVIGRISSKIFQTFFSRDPSAEELARCKSELKEAIKANIHVICPPESQ